MRMMVVHRGIGFSMCFVLDLRLALDFALDLALVFALDLALDVRA